MMPNNELASYAHSIETRFDELARCVEQLDARTLNWRPPYGDANSIAVIATHAAGNARAWIIGIVSGEDISRDRASEFAVKSANGATLAASLRAQTAELTAAITALDPARLDVRLTPRRELWGAGEPYELSVRDSILHVIEHASLHLGHLHVTRDATATARAATAVQSDE